MPAEHARQRGELAGCAGRRASGKPHVDLLSERWLEPDTSAYWRY